MKIDKKHGLIGAVVAAVGIGYFGLSAYASAQAEKTIEDWLYDKGLDSEVRWSSVRSSPLGGTVTIKNLEFVGEQKSTQHFSFVVERLQIKNFRNDDKRKSIALDFGGLNFPSIEKGMGATLFGELLMESGRDELSPFDLRLAAEYDGDDAIAALEYRVDVPGMFLTAGSLELKKVPRFDRFADLASDARLGMSSGYARWDAILFGMVEQLDAVELGDVSLSLEDQGYFKRQFAIQQRYTQALDPIKGDYDDQRKVAAEREMRSRRDGCAASFGSMLPKPDEACEAAESVLLGGGVRLSISPERSVRVADVIEQGIRGGRAKNLVERMNLKIKSI